MSFACLKLISDYGVMHLTLLLIHRRRLQYTHPVKRIVANAGSADYTVDPEKSHASPPTVIGVIAVVAEDKNVIFRDYNGPIIRPRALKYIRLVNGFAIKIQNAILI